MAVVIANHWGPTDRVSSRNGKIDLRVTGRNSGVSAEQAESQ
jgi:hypothetical protein